MRQLLVRSVEVLRMNEIDNVKQTFKAQILFIFVFPGGGKDPALSAPSSKDDNGREIFPLDDDGKPTFKPSAWWYLDQCEINNVYDAGSLTLSEKKVMREKDDLILSFRVEGEFTVTLVLEDFPVDTHVLPVNLVLCCRKQGKLACELVIPHGAAGYVIADGNHLHQLFKIKATADEDGQPCGECDLEVYDHGRKGREFPALSCAVTVRRRPGFFLTNVTVPMGLFSLLSLMQFQLPTEDVTDRLSISLTLLLTAAAYKFATSSLVPAISYMTFLDDYVVRNCGILAVATIAGGAVNLLNILDTPFGADRSGGGGPLGAYRRLSSAASRNGADVGSSDDGAYGLAEKADVLLFFLVLVWWVAVQVRTASWLLDKLQMTLAEAMHAMLGNKQGGSQVEVTCQVGVVRTIRGKHKHQLSQGANSSIKWMH